MKLPLERGVLTRRGLRGIYTPSVWRQIRDHFFFFFLPALWISLQYDFKETFLIFLRWKFSKNYYSTLSFLSESVKNFDFTGAYSFKISNFQSRSFYRKFTTKVRCDPYIPKLYNFWKWYQFEILWIKTIIFTMKSSGRKDIFQQINNIIFWNYINKYYYASGHLKSIRFEWYTTWTTRITLDKILLYPR